MKTTNGWFVRVGDRWESRLCTDEALGVVASMMYRGEAPYIRTAVEHALWESKYGPTMPLLNEFAVSQIRTL